MPWINGTFHRSNGDNTGASVWQQDQSEDVAILAPRHDEHDQDFADGLNEVAGGLGTFAKTDIASAATCNIGAVDTSVVRITGTTTITSLGTVANTRKWVYFAAALTLTHNASSLILPGAANIITAAGDTMLVVSDASGNWRCWSYVVAASVGLFDGDKGDITVSGGGTVWTIDNDAVTFAKLQNIATDRLLGRDTAATGNVEEISLDDTLEMTGAGALQRAALTGDISAPAGSNVTTLATVNSNVGQFGSASAVSRPTVNAKGLVTAVDTVTIAIASTAVTDFQEAVEDVVGALLPASEGTGDLDWTYTDATPALHASVKSDAVTNAKLADMATSTIKGRTTAGTGDPEDLSATQATALLNAVVGDSGSGGTKGLVPAPAAGDASAGKFLKADGTFAVPPTGSGAFALIQTQVASSSAQLDFETGLDDTYDAFELRFSSLVPATDDVQLQIQVKVSGSYQTTGYLSGIFAVTSAASTAAASSTSAILVNRAAGGSGGVGNVSGENISGVARFSNPEGTTDLMMVETRSVHRRADAAGETAFGGGFYNTAGAVTGIRVKFSSGNITSGRVSLYALAK